MHHLFTTVCGAKGRRLQSFESTTSTNTSTSNPAHAPAGPTNNPFAFAGGKCKAAARSLGWRSIYMFVSLLALLGASGSQSKLIEFVCKQLGGSNRCPPPQTCPAGEALYHKPHSKPSYDGCGTHGLKISLSQTDFSSCCNLHDLCYGQCGRRKKECDEYFESCMLAQCQREHHTNSSSSSSSSSHPHRHPKDGQSKELKRCMRAAKLYYHGVYGFGCFAYRKAQKMHCECRPLKDEEEEEEFEGWEMGGGESSAAAGGSSGGYRKDKKDVWGGLLAVMERAGQADTPTTKAVRWEEELL